MQLGLVVSFADEGDAACFIDAMRAVACAGRISLVVFASEVDALHFVRDGLGEMLSPQFAKSEVAN